MSDPMSKDEQQPCGHVAGPQPDDRRGGTADPCGRGKGCWKDCARPCVLPPDVERSELPARRARYDDGRGGRSGLAEVRGCPNATSPSSCCRSF